MVRNSRVTVRLYNTRVILFIRNIIMAIVRIIRITTQLSLIISAVITTGVVYMGVVTVIGEIIIIIINVVSMRLIIIIMVIINIIVITIIVIDIFKKPIIIIDKCYVMSLINVMIRLSLFLISSFMKRSCS